MRLFSGWIPIAVLLAGCVLPGEDPPPVGDDDDDDVVGDDDDDDVPGPEERCVPGDGSLSLLPGFCASIVADNVGNARHMVVSPNGDLYVALNDSFDGTEIGGLIALRDGDDDGVAEMSARIMDGGGNGVAWYNGMLYFAQPDRIVRFTVPDGSLVPEDNQPEIVVRGLPDTGDHTAKSILIDDDGTMFVNIGSASNSCQVVNRETGSPGVDPCPELDERAGIWTFDANTLDQTAADGVRYATGLRNANAIAFEPGTGNVVAAPNGRDEFLDDWPALYSPFEDMMLPSEELFVVQQDGDYGWPYCYFDPAVGKVLAPEYGGDGLTAGRCAATLDPDMTFPAHWAPLGLHFLTGEEFPTSMQGGMLVTFHGSWHEPGNAGPLPGYNVGFVPWDSTGPRQELITFAWGFAGDVTEPLPMNAEHRPVGLAQAPDGSLYISDDQGGRIWRVFWSAN